MRMKHRVALVGAGRWGRNILRSLEGLAEVSAIVHGGSLETKAFLEAQYPTLLITDVATVLADATINTVCIATPISTHADLVRMALNAGKHVFVEKPLSRNPKIVAELYDLAAQKGCVLFTGYIYAYDPTFEELIRRTKDASDITASFVWKKYGSFDSSLIENLLVHDIGLAHELLGKGELEVTNLEENFFSGVYRTPRGSAHIVIDRESSAKTKTITVVADGKEYRHNTGFLETSTNGAHAIVREQSGELLTIELKVFFDCLNDLHIDNEKRRRADLAIAAALERLPA